MTGVFDVKQCDNIDTEKSPQERVEAMAKPVLAAVRKAFEDPETMKDYKSWLEKRATKQTKGATA
jgi:hypothetical protein